MYMPSRQLPSKFEFFGEPSGQLSYSFKPTRFKLQLPYSFKCINSNFFCVKCWVKIFITLFVRYMKKLLSSDWSR